jgi:hypothetical protein
MSNQPFDWNSYEQEFQHYAVLYKEKKRVTDAFKAISAGKAAIDGFKTLTQYANEVKDTQKRGELMGVIGELSLELAETEMRLAGQLRENIDLRQQVEALKKEIEKSKTSNTKPILDDGLYFLDDAPICTACYSVKQISIPVTRVGYLTSNNEYECPYCHAKYLHKR